MATISSPIVSSAADMLSSVPADLFDGIEAAPDTSGGDDAAEELATETAAEPVDDVIETAGDAPADEPAAEAAPDETPAAETDAEVKPEAKPADAGATEDELPEGVSRGKDRKGKAGYFLEENRYQTFHGNHKLVQEAATLLGEPLTSDALKLRQQAYLGQERLFTNLTSADPALQSDVLKFVINEMKGAQANGEVGSDPTIPFATSVYQTLQKEAPQAYEALRLQAAKDLTSDLYDAAANSGDANFASTAQRIGMAMLNIPSKPAGMPDAEYAAYVRDTLSQNGFRFHTLDEVAKLTPAQSDPVAARDARIAELEAQIKGGSQTGAAEQYSTWAKNSVKDVNSAVLDEAVKPALQSVEAGWKAFPADYKRLVVDPLHREVVAAVKADPELHRQVTELQQRAMRATSEQVRAQLAAQVKQLFVNRAKQAADASKPPIVKFAAELLKGKSDKNHERQAGAQARTTPKGPSAPVKTSLAPPEIGFKDGIFDSATAMKQMQSLFR